MITSIIAENSTDNIRKHIHQKTISKSFSKVWLCIRGDGGDIEESLYRSWSESNQ